MDNINANAYKETLHTTQTQMQTHKRSPGFTVSPDITKQYVSMWNVHCTIYILRYSHTHIRWADMSGCMELCRVLGGHSLLYVLYNLLWEYKQGHYLQLSILHYAVLSPWCIYYYCSYCSGHIGASCVTVHILLNHTCLIVCLPFWRIAGSNQDIAVESNQRLSNLYLSLPSLVLGIIRIG